MTKVYTPKVSVDPRGMKLYVVSKGQPLPPFFVDLPTRERAPGIPAAREVVRIAGGCKGMTEEIVKRLPDYFREAFAVWDGGFMNSGIRRKVVREFRGTAFSGGTANVEAKTGEIKTDMVTNMPAVLADAYHCVAMSTTPRTGDLALNNKGQLIVDAYGSRLDHRQQAAVIYQQDPANVLDWDGDVELYLTLMEGYKMTGFATAILALNGGDITRNEIYGALSRGIPVIAVEGSLRETDAFVKAARDGDWSATAAEMRAKLREKKKDEAPADAVVARCKEQLESVDRSLVSIVKIGDADALRTALQKHDFLKG